MIASRQIAATMYALCSTVFGARIASEQTQALGKLKFSASSSTTYVVFYDLYDLSEDAPPGGGVAGSITGSLAGSVYGSASGGPLTGSLAGSAGGIAGASAGYASQRFKSLGSLRQTSSGHFPSFLEANISSVSGSSSVSSGGGGFTSQLMIKSFDASAVEVHKANLSESTVRASLKGLSHSEVVLCETSDFSASDRQYLQDHMGSIVPEDWFASWARSRLISCHMFGFGGDDCDTTACGIYHRSVSLKAASSPPYGRRSRIPIGITTIAGSSYRLGSTIMNRIMERRDRWRGVHYGLVNHNCNSFARFLVRCILEMSMPRLDRLGIDFVVSSGTWTSWLGGILGSAVAGAHFGPAGLIAGPLIFMLTPRVMCD